MQRRYPGITHASTALPEHPTQVFQGEIMQSEPHVDQNTQLPITPKQRRGFAVIDKEKMRQVASRGGRTAHAHGLAHKFTSEKAREEGRKSGALNAANREHMAEIGRIGGLAKRGHRRYAAPRQSLHARCGSGISLRCVPGRHPGTPLVFHSCNRR